MVLHEPIHINTESPYCKQALNQLGSQNWCSARTSILKFQTLGLYYVASLLPSYESFPHYSDCRGTSCAHRAKALSQLQAQHRYENCAGNCPEIIFEEARLISILNAGGNPGIMKTKNSQGNVTYEIVDITKTPTSPSAMSGPMDLGTPHEMHNHSAKSSTPFSSWNALGPASCFGLIPCPCLFKLSTRGWQSSD